MGTWTARSTPEHAAGLSGEPCVDLPALLIQAAKGDERAWRMIVTLYARRVYALARSRLRGSGGWGGPHRSLARSGGSGPWPEGDDAAEEVTESVFCTVAAKLSKGEYTEQGRFESWLFRVAMNRIRDEVRRRKRQAEPTDPEAFSETPARVSTLDGPDRATPDELGALRAALDHLAEADREVIELRHHAGMSFKAIAELLDEPIGTLLARHHRALRKLKDSIEAAGGIGEPDNQEHDLKGGA